MANRLKTNTFNMKAKNEEKGKEEDALKKPTHAAVLAFTLGHTAANKDLGASQKLRDGKTSFSS